MRRFEILIVIGLLLMAGRTWAQPQVAWQKTYGGPGDDVCNSLIQTSDGGFAMAGHTNLNYETGRCEFWFVRTNESGDTLWMRNYGQNETSGWSSLIQTVDGGFAMAGDLYSQVTSLRHFLLVRTDCNGNLRWVRSFGGVRSEVCTSIIQTADSGFAMAGYTESLGAGRRDFWLVKTDQNGDSLWSSTFGGRNDEECSSVIQTLDGGYALTGLTRSFGAGGSDGWMVRTDEYGDSLWSRTFGSHEDDACLSVIQTADSGFALAGYYQGYPVRGDVWLIRTNKNGDSLWSRTYGGEDAECGNDIIQTDDGGFAIAGTTRSFGLGGDAWLVRTDRHGDSLWSCSFGGGYYEEGHSLIETANREFVLAGVTGTYGAGNGDFYLVKTTPDPVSVRDSSPLTPYTLNLSPAFPNPFNSTTRIGFSIPPGTAGLRLAVFDPLGRRVAELIPNGGFGNPPYAAGRHEAVWDAGGFPAGEYVIVLSGGNGLKAAQKLTLVK